MFNRVDRIREFGERDREGGERERERVRDDWRNYRC